MFFSVFSASSGCYQVSFVSYHFFVQSQILITASIFDRVRQQQVLCGFQTRLSGGGRDVFLSVLSTSSGYYDFFTATSHFLFQSQILITASIFGRVRQRQVFAAAKPSLAEGGGALLSSCPHLTKIPNLLLVVLIFGPITYLFDNNETHK